MRLRRRRLLVCGVAVAAGSAGCTGGEPRRTATPIYVTNETETSQTVTVRVIEEGNDGEELLVSRSELSADGGSVAIDEELPVAELVVRVTTRDGPDGEVNWERADELSTLDARITDGSVRFTELD